MVEVSREEQVKLYIIDTAQKAFGQGAVSRLVQHGDAMDLYVYTPPRMNTLQTEEHLAKVFDANVFDDGDVLSSVAVRYRGLENSGLPNEQMYKVTFNGPLTEMADNVEKNDAAGFLAAQESHLAEQVLRREQALKKKREGP